MDESNEIPVDIAKTLNKYLPDDRQATAYIGPEGPPEAAKRPSVHLCVCNEGRVVVWNDHAGGSVGSAYECGYDGSKKAAGFINEVVDGISHDDSVPIEFNGDENIIEEITSHLSFSDNEHVELNR
jgi:hypothetical protein